MTPTRWPRAILVGPFVFVVAFAFAAPSSAFADSVSVGDLSYGEPVAGGNVGPAGNLSGLTPPTATGSLVGGSGWAAGQRYDDGALAISEGADGDRFDVSTRFAGVQVVSDEEMVRSFAWEWDNTWSAWNGQGGAASLMGGFESIPAPEPISLVLFGLGAVGLLWLRHRRRGRLSYR